MNSLLQYILKQNNNPALCIDNVFYSYSELEKHSSVIQTEIITNHYYTDIFGIVFNNDLETYATIIAVWATGKGFILIEEDNDREANYTKIQTTSCSIIFNTNYIIPDNLNFLEQLHIINPLELKHNNNSLKILLTEDNILLYEFTESFDISSEIIQFQCQDIINAIDCIKELKISLSKNDKVLSFFKFSHPLSIFSFMLSINAGACFYTTPNNINRAFITFSMVDEHQITFSFTTPYAIKMLEPFFDDISLTSLKYLLITGDLLDTKHAQSILKCAPNANIFNTDYSSNILGITAAIEIDDISHLETHNTIISSGFPLKSIKYLVYDHHNIQLKPGEIGEFFIQNQKSSFNSSFIDDNKLLDDNINFSKSNDKLDDFTLYKTGIIGFINNNNAIIKTANIYKLIIINNIPIDLSLLELNTANIVKSNDIVAIAYSNLFGYTEIHLFIQNLSTDTNTIYQYLKNKIPEYLLPQQIHNINQIPINNNCFIDYPQILRIIQNKEKNYLT